MDESELVEGGSADVATDRLTALRGQLVRLGLAGTQLSGLRPGYTNTTMVPYNGGRQDIVVGVLQVSFHLVR